MKLTKTQWIIVAIVGVVAIYYFFLRNKGNTNKSMESKQSGGSNDLYIYAGYGIVSGDKQPVGLKPIAGFVGGKYFRYKTSDCPNPPCSVTQDQINDFEWNKLAEQYAKK